VTIIDGGELGFADSGEHLQRGMADYQQLRTNWLDSFGQDASLIKPDH
jgi:hypothetical protein